MSWLTSAGPLYLKMGYTILPISTGFKFPQGFPWQGIPQTIEEIARWDKLGYTGVGINCHNLGAFDIDIMDQATMLAVSNMIGEVTGGLGLVRIGMPPKRLLLYRTTAAIKKSKTPLFLSRGFEHRLEFLGNGQMFVAAHIHPDTKKPFIWPKRSPGDTPYADLPVVSQDQVATIIERAAAIMVKQGWRLKQEDSRPAKSGTVVPIKSALLHMRAEPLPLTVAEIAAILDTMPVAKLDAYDTWIITGMALHHQTKGDPLGLALWVDASARSSKYEPGCCDSHWQSFSAKPDNEAKITFATVTKWHREQAPVSQPGAKTVLTVAEFDQLPLTKEVMFIAPWFGPGTVTLVYGRAGIGKSYLVLDLLRAVHEGSEFLSMPIDLTVKPRSLYVDGEMTSNMLQGRLRDVYGDGSLPKDAYVFSKLYWWSQHKDAAGFNLIEPWCREMLDAAIEEYKINIVVLDNKSSLLPGVDEDKTNDNAPFVLWMKQLCQSGVAVVLVHHPNKQGGLRGAISYEDNIDTTLKLSMVGQELLQRNVVFEKHRRGVPPLIDQVTEGHPSMQIMMTAMGTLPVTFTAKQFADEGMQKILMALQAPGGDKLSQRKIAAAADMPESSVRRHLKDMLATKYIKRKGKDQHIRHQITPLGAAYLIQDKGDEFGSIDPMME